MHGGHRLAEAEARHWRATCRARGIVCPVKSRPQTMLVGVIAGIAVAVGAVGCGRDDERPAPTTPAEIEENVPDVLYTDPEQTDETVTEPPPYPAGSAQAGMRDVVVRFYRAVQDGNGEAACRLLTDDGQEALVDSLAASGEEVEDCAQAAVALRASAEGIVIGDATEDEPGSGTGLVRTQIPGISPAHVEVSKQGDRWLIELF